MGAREQGARTLALIMSPGSTMPAESSRAFQMLRPEIGFRFNQGLFRMHKLLWLTLLGLALGRQRGHLPRQAKCIKIARELKAIQPS